MANKKKPVKTVPSKQDRNIKTPQRKTVQPVSSGDFFTALDNFFDKRRKLFLWICLSLTVLFSTLLFDVKVSDGGDDSAYIVRAYDFIHDFSYPGFQGALYPMMLSIFVAVFGVNLPVLKFLSLVFITFHLIFFYKAFKNKISPFLQAMVMILISVNTSLLYFASQTYSEAFYLFLQGWFFLIVFNYFITENSEPVTIKNSYKKFLLLGLSMFLLGLNRSIGYGSVISVVLFFALERQWKKIVFAIGGFMVFSLPYEFLKKILWAANDIQFQNQAKLFFQKDAYNAAKGSEDLSGYIGRFFDNSNLYLSKHLFYFFGFTDGTVIYPFLTFLVYLLFALAIYWAFRKNRYLLFTSIYTGVLCFITFILLQKQWDQARLVIIYYPLILVILFGGLFYLLKTEKLKKVQFILPLLILVIFFSTFSTTGPKVKEKKEILGKNLSGDMLYGLTPDWINFINLSKWAAKNIPAGEEIGSRKADISFIYSSRKFVSLYKVPNIEPDSLLKKIKGQKISVIAVKLNEINNNQPGLIVTEQLRKNAIAFINGNKTDENGRVKEAFMYGVYSVAESDIPAYSEKLDQAKLTHRSDLDKFFAEAKKDNKNIMIYEPDVMLERLEKTKVKYVIMASLRKNPKVKTGEIIDTINRFLYFIQLKYPAMFSEKYVIGADEPAKLIEIHYDKKT